MYKALALLVVIGLMTISPMVMADDNDTTFGYKDTATTWWHNHQIYDPDRRAPLGGGLDLVVFESNSILEDVVIESRYDFQNEELSAFAVGRINLFKAVKNILE